MLLITTLSDISYFLNTQMFLALHKASFTQFTIIHQHVSPFSQVVFKKNIHYNFMSTLLYLDLSTTVLIGPRLFFAKKHSQNMFNRLAFPTPLSWALCTPCALPFLQKSSCRQTFLGSLPR